MIWLSLVLAALVEGQQPRPLQPTLHHAGTIEGVVVTEDSQRTPVRRATVTLSGGSLVSPRNAVTHEDGSFRFTAIPDGEYVLGASKLAYVSPRLPTRVGIIQGAEPVRVELLLNKGGVISGRIQDDFGEAWPGASVALLQRDPSNIGVVRRVDSLRSGGTGEFRFFGLADGRYLVTTIPLEGDLVGVRVVPQSWFAALEASPPSDARDQTSDLPETGYVPSFYRGTTSVQFAEEIVVSGGEERSGVVLVPIRADLGRIVGTVQNPFGTPADVELWFSWEAYEFGLYRSSNVPRERVSPSGTFVRNGVPPGQHRIVARTKTQSGRTAVAEAHVALADGQTVTLVLAPALGLELQGHLNGDAATASQVRLTRLDALENAYVSPVNQDGRFSFVDLLPGTYEVQMLGLPRHRVLRADVEIGGQWMPLSELTVTIGEAQPVWRLRVEIVER